MDLLKKLKISNNVNKIKSNLHFFFFLILFFFFSEDDALDIAGLDLRFDSKESCLNIDTTATYHLIFITVNVSYIEYSLCPSNGFPFAWRPGLDGRCCSEQGMDVSLGCNQCWPFFKDISQQPLYSSFLFSFNFVPLV